MLIAEQIFVNTCRAAFGKSLHDRRLPQFLLEHLMRFGEVQLGNWEIGSLGIALLWTLPNSPARPALAVAIDGHAELSRLADATNTLLSDYWPYLARVIAYRPTNNDLHAGRLADACGSRIEPDLIRTFERLLLVDSRADIRDWLRSAPPAGPHSIGPHRETNLANLVRVVVRDVITDHRGDLYKNIRLEFLRRCLQRLHHLEVNNTPRDFLDQIEQSDPLDRRLMEVICEVPAHQRLVLLATAFGAFSIEDLATALSDDGAPFDCWSGDSDEVLSELRFAWNHVFRKIS